jgi:hypothetical protein
MTLTAPVSRWSPRSVGDGAAAAALVLTAAPAAGDPDTPTAYPSAASATRTSGLGFDGCSAPAVASLRARRASPYRTVSTYFGGVNRACTQPNVTASWVTSVTAQGWRILPTYMGRQPFCMFGTKPYHYTDTDATAYGDAEAADAVSRGAGPKARERLVCRRRLPRS